MKNLTIAILTGILVSNGSFWLYADWLDKVLIVVSTTIIVLCALSFVDDRVSEYRHKKLRAERLKRSIKEMQESSEKGRPCRRQA